MKKYLAHLDFILDLREGVLRQAEKPLKLPKARRHSRPQKQNFAAAQTQLRISPEADDRLSLIQGELMAEMDP